MGTKILIGLSALVILIIMVDAVGAMPLRDFGAFACHHEMGQDVCIWDWGRFTKVVCNVGLGLIMVIFTVNAEHLRSMKFDKTHPRCHTWNIKRRSER